MNDKPLTVASAIQAGHKAVTADGNFVHIVDYDIHLGHKIVMLGIVYNGDTRPKILRIGLFSKETGYPLDYEGNFQNPANFKICPAPKTVEGWFIRYRIDGHVLPTLQGMYTSKELAQTTMDEIIKVREGAGYLSVVESAVEKIIFETPFKLD